MFSNFYRFKSVKFFSLFLFFLSFFVISCQKKNAEGKTVNEEASENPDAKSGQPEEQYDELFELLTLYNPAIDDASWVEESLLRTEEERIAMEMGKLEASLEEYNELEPQAENENAGVTEAQAASDSDKKAESENAAKEKPLYVSKTAEEIEKYFSGETLENSLSDEKGSLRFYESGSEILVPQKTPSGMTVIHADGNNVTRIFYDNLYRIVSRETWEIPGANAAKKIRTETLEYADGEHRLISKSVSTENSLEEITYNDSALVKNIVHYVIEKEKKYKTLERHCIYNEENKIKSDETIEYKYKTDYKKLDYSFSKKYIYSYNEGDLPPDFSYYENDVLIMKNKYSTDKSTYTSQVFFEGGLSVKTYYEKGIRIKDVYTKDDAVLREKLYEQNTQNEQEVVNDKQ